MVTTGSKKNSGMITVIDGIALQTHSLAKTTVETAWPSPQALVPPPKPSDQYFPGLQPASYLPNRTSTVPTRVNEVSDEVGLTTGESVAKFPVAVIVQPLALPVLKKRDFSRRI